MRLCSGAFGAKISEGAGGAEERAEKSEPRTACNKEIGRAARARLIRFRHASLGSSFSARRFRLVLFGSSFSARRFRLALFVWPFSAPPFLLPLFLPPLSPLP